MTPEPSLLSIALDIIKTAFAVFAGAGLAFWSNRHFKRQKEREDRIAAGNLACFTVSRYANAYMNFRKAMKDHRTKLENEIGASAVSTLPIWAQVPNVLTNMDSNITINFDALYFLLRKESQNLLGELSVCQNKYLAFVQFVDEYNRSHLEMQEILSKEASLGTDADPNFVIAIIGPSLDARLSNLSRAILDGIPMNLEYTLRIANELHSKLVEQFGSDLFIKLAEDTGE